VEPARVFRNNLFAQSVPPPEEKGHCMNIGQVLEELLISFII
jgi:hypothetical protein